MAGNGSSHQNLSMNGMNSGHSGNNGIMNGSSGNITNVGFGNNTAGQTNAFPSGFTQSSNGVGASNNTNSGKGIILQNLIESNNLQVKFQNKILNVSYIIKIVLSAATYFKMHIISPIIRT